jgi:hypothetical protein
MQHPSIALAVGHARQHDIERQLGQAGGIARRELEPERSGRVRRPGRLVALGRRIARLFPAARRSMPTTDASGRADLSSQRVGSPV